MMSTVDNEAVILGIKSGEYFGLNDIGTVLWKMLDHPVKVSDLITELVETYSGTEKTIRADVIEYISALHSKDLILEIDETD
ncbi:MAG: PqqD family protein [Bacteroidales bacterium]|nr:PqqD family protein [Bacteroidales bacterium]